MGNLWETYGFSMGQSLSVFKYSLNVRTHLLTSGYTLWRHRPPSRDPRLLSNLISLTSGMGFTSCEVTSGPPSYPCTVLHNIKILAPDWLISVTWAEYWLLIGYVPKWPGILLPEKFRNSQM